LVKGVAHELALALDDKVVGVYYLGEWLKGMSED
jgi:hypothetical protein